MYPIFKPHCGAFAAFPKQDDKIIIIIIIIIILDKCLGGEDRTRLEMTEPLIENVILPGKLSILCHIQYLNKTAQKSFKNTEQLGIFHKFIF